MLHSFVFKHPENILENIGQYRSKHKSNKCPENNRSGVKGWNNFNWMERDRDIQLREKKSYFTRNQLWNKNNKSINAIKKIWN